MKAEVILIENHKEIDEARELNQRGGYSYDLPEEKLIRSTIWFDADQVSMAYITSDGYLNIKIDGEYWCVNPTDEVIAAIDLQFTKEES